MRNKTAVYSHELSLTQALEHLSQEPKFNRGEVSKTQSTSFAGATWKDSAHMARHGDKPGLERIEEQARKLLPEVTRETDGRKLHKVAAVSGGRVNVAAFLAGDPYCMESAKIEGASTRIVNFLVHIGALGCVDTEAMRRRGSAIFTAIRALELAGYSVGLRVVGASHNNGLLAHYITLKRHQDYLDPAVAAYWIACPAAFRRSVFRLRETQTPDQEWSKLEAHDAGHFSTCDVIPREDEVYLPCITPADNSTPAKEWMSKIRSKLVEQGVNL